MLIDTGNGGAASARDAGRIMEGVQAAGLTQIDYLISTHWHGDHYGGLAELAGRVPIRRFFDHGANTQPAQAVDTFLQPVYPGCAVRARLYPITITRVCSGFSDRRLAIETVAFGLKTVCRFTWTREQVLTR